LRQTATELAKRMGSLAMSCQGTITAIHLHGRVEQLASALTVLDDPEPMPARRRVQADRFSAARHGTAPHGRPDARQPVLRAQVHDRHRSMVARMTSLGHRVAWPHHPTS
jgi:hypothetical protein